MSRRTKPHTPSSLVNRNVLVGARRTSIRLEPDLWAALENIAKRQTRRIQDITTEIGQAVDGEQGLTSAVRIYIVRQLQQEAA